MRFLVVTALLLSSAACMSARYPTRSNGRVSWSLRNGQAGFVRDGVFYPRGMLGGGLAAAVAGDPEAERLARRYASRTGWGMLFGLGGLVCSEVALLSMIEETDQNTRDTATAVAIGCAVAGVYGMWMTFDAMPDQFDAINLYNDNAEQRRLAAPPPAPWPPPSRNPGQVRP
jgi:hypothetical protein